MKQLNITARIWLSIGVFVIGYMLSTTLALVQGHRTETALQTTSDALFPAAQGMQEAEASYQRMVKGFSDAVMVQDASGLDRAAEEGKRLVQGLEKVVAVEGLPPARKKQVGELVSAVQQYLGDARSTYGTFLSNPAAMTPEMQQRMGDLAGKSDSTKASLTRAREEFSADLQHQLAVLRENSAFQRWLVVGMFAVSILVATVIVNLTIRRSITGPISKVIKGVDLASDEATAASDRMARSGQEVANNAQEQAACIEETSASLEEIASTTNANADRAKDADKLMTQARIKVDRAAEAMDALTASMGVISKSSKQVSDVLSSIDQIAFQTNILALNAAVEAARAGSAGAGFSVVADEVRSLAHRAAEAAQRSGEIIAQTISDVAKGVQLVGLAHSTFHEVSGSITQGSEMVSQIALSSEEQARAIGHIGTAVTRIEQVTQANASSAHETALTAAQLSEQVQTTRRHLDELVTVVGLTR